MPANTLIEGLREAIFIIEDRKPSSVDEAVTLLRKGLKSREDEWSHDVEIWEKNHEDHIMRLQGNLPPEFREALSKQRDLQSVA